MATASARVARRHGNAACDPLLPFGHPPAGTYGVATSLPPGYSHPRRPLRFGGAGALLLDPRGGDALASRAHGRRVFALHGGPMDAANRLRPTRGGLRMSDPDMNALLRAINAAQASDDPLDVIELLEVTDDDIRSVPPSDLRGARHAAAVPRRSRGAAGNIPTAKGGMVLLLGLGAVEGLGDKELDRREMLRAALVLVGGLVSTACNSQPSPCTPLACDPSEGGLGDDGGLDLGDGAAPGDASPDVDASRDGGGHRGPVPCPPSGYVCQDNSGGYAVGGGVG